MDLRDLKHLVQRKQQLKRGIKSREQGKRQHRTSMSHVMVNRTETRHPLAKRETDRDNHDDMLDFTFKPQPNDELLAPESTIRSLKSEFSPIKISSVARDDVMLRNSLI